MESAVQEPYRVLLALRPVRVRADLVIRKRTRRSCRPAARECEKAARSGFADRRTAKLHKSPERTVRLRRM